MSDADKTSLDLVSALSPEELAVARHNLQAVSPDDGKYAKAANPLRKYLSVDAEWKACITVQRALLQTRVDFGQAQKKNLDELDAAIPKLDTLNISLLEDKVTKHDQLAVLEEIGRFVSAETKSLLHPGTTSYDVLDTARSYLFRECWHKALKPKIAEVVKKLCDLGETYIDVIQVGRTHIQQTSPVSFGGVLAGYAARLAERMERCDSAFNSLRGKVSGIVGTGASIDAVIGEGKAPEFEGSVLAKFYMKPDHTASQIVQKERLCDVGHSVVTLMHVLGDFANDMRILYSSEIQEVTSRSGAKRLGGSSADAGKNNPISWENIAGKTVVVESGMRVLYAMIQSDLQRDLRGSVQARYQPQQMIAETYEAFSRASKSLDDLSVNTDRMEANLAGVRNSPTEAMTAILRGHGYIHPEHGVGHDAVKKFAREANKLGRPLFNVACEDPHFAEFFMTLSKKEQKIIAGDLERYMGCAKEKAQGNIYYAREIAG